MLVPLILGEKKKLLGSSLGPAAGVWVGLGDGPVESRSHEGQ
jgi:hypothetical protein